MSKFKHARDLKVIPEALRWLTRFAALACAFALAPAVFAQQTEANAGETSFRYDGIGRLVGEIGPDPDTTGPLKYPAKRTVYDQAGLVVRVESGQLAAWQPTSVNPASWPNFTILKTEKYFHDTMGRVVRTEVWGPGDSTATSFTQVNYDHEGRTGCTVIRMDPSKFATAPANACTQTSSTIGLGWDRITRNVYDVDGQLRQVRKALDNATEIADVTYIYTLNGKLKNVIDANGNCAEMRYDGHDRLVRWVFPSQTRRTYNAPAYTAATCPASVLNEQDFEAYTYDRVGNRLSLTKRDGAKISYQYDALNRVKLKDIDPTGARGDLTSIDKRDVYYTYNMQGWQLSARFGANSNDPGIVNTYTGFGELKTTVSSFISGNPDLEFTYDEKGNRTSIAYPDGPAFALSFDRLNRLKDIKKSSTSTVLAAATYLSNGALDKITRAGSAYIEDYGYDNAGRLNELELGTTGSSHVEWTFQRNAASQIKTELRDNDLYAWTGRVNVPGTNYTTNGLNQYTQIGTTGFCYDRNGNLTADGDTVYLYDVENRLVEVHERVSPNVCPGNGSGYSGDWVAKLHYDPVGRLYEAVQYDGVGAANAPTKDTRFLYDGDAMVMEYNHPSSGLDTIAGRYVHGSDVGADDPLIWYNGSTTADTDVRNLYADPRGSIVLVMASNGTTANINTYDEWGAPDEANVGRFQYTGQIWLPEVGLYYYKARIYSQRLGRFLQTDPIGYEGGNNLYAYVSNDPINNTDPKGLEAFCVSHVPSNCWGEPDDPETPKRESRAGAIMGAMAASYTLAFAWEYLVVPASVAAADQAAVRLGQFGFRQASSSLARAEGFSTAGLRRTMTGSIDKIRNILSTNATEGDFIGAARESRGIKTGFDHVTEMQNSIRGLRASVKSLEGSLKNPNLSSQAQGTLRAWRNTALESIDAMTKTLGY